MAGARPSGRYRLEQARRWAGIPPLLNFVSPDTHGGPSLGKRRTWQPDGNGRARARRWQAHKQLERAIHGAAACDGGILNSCFRVEGTESLAHWRRPRVYGISQAAQGHFAG